MPPPRPGFSLPSAAPTNGGLRRVVNKARSAANGQGQKSIKKPD